MRALKRAGRGAADPTRGSRPCRRGALALMAVLTAVLGSTSGTQDAVANGDTRTISIFHEHTKESASITFKRDGRYDRAALEQLNWLLRDWRLDEPTKMDPRLFDVVWEAHRAVGSQDAIHVVSAYRSPQTNAALRRRSRAVAEHSQHMLGKAMDFYLADVSIDRIRAIGMQMQRGGVGWYPQANSPFVHLDVGSVRSWPRMSHDQLARLFPDGRTVHLPADGRPMPGYDMAKAEILARGGSVMGVSQAIAAADEEDSPNVVGQFFAMLFGGAKPAAPPPPAPVVLSARSGRVRPVALASAQPDEAGTRTAMAYADAAAPSALMPEAAPRQAALRAPDPVPQEAPAALPATPDASVTAAEPDTSEAPETPAKSRLAAAPLPPPPVRVRRPGDRHGRGDVGRGDQGRDDDRRGDADGRPGRRPRLGAPAPAPARLDPRRLGGCRPGGARRHAPPPPRRGAVPRPGLRGSEGRADGKLQTRMPFTATLPVLLPTKVTAKGVPAHPSRPGDAEGPARRSPGRPPSRAGRHVAARLHRGATRTARRPEARAARRPRGADMRAAGAPRARNRPGAAERSAVEPIHPGADARRPLTPR